MKAFKYEDAEMADDLRRYEAQRGKRPADLNAALENYKQHWQRYKPDLATASKAEADAWPEIEGESDGQHT